MCRCIHKAAAMALAICTPFKYHHVGMMLTASIVTVCMVHGLSSMGPQAAAASSCCCTWCKFFLSKHDDQHCRYNIISMVSADQRGKGQVDIYIAAMCCSALHAATLHTMTTAAPNAHESCDMTPLLICQQCRRHQVSNVE
jgi:hypothetical protein